jgi:hypothetical protein
VLAPAFGRIVDTALVEMLRMRRTSLIMVAIFGAILMAPRSWAWFAEGHEIVAVIAADHLTPAA